MGRKITIDIQTTQCPKFVLLANNTVTRPSSPRNLLPSNLKWSFSNNPWVRNPPHLPIRNPCRQSAKVVLFLTDLLCPLIADETMLKNTIEPVKFRDRKAKNLSALFS